jgi:hypothetical protein
MPRKSGFPKMDGRYRNKMAEHENKIESWMRTVIRDGGVDRYDELHINRIDNSWKDKTVWLSAALHAYDLSLNIRNREHFAFTVALALSLVSATRRLGVTFNTRIEIEEELDKTPPSLYLFRPSEQPWLRLGANKNDVVTLDSSLFGTSIRATSCFYLEFKNTLDDQYARTIFVMG